jgi:hypothetical protein
MFPGFSAFAYNLLVSTPHLVLAARADLRQQDSASPPGRVQVYVLSKERSGYSTNGPTTSPPT